MSFIRDFFRRRRVRAHVARHGWRFAYHGIEVTIPDLGSPGVASALLRGKYEREEAELIMRHLPADAPVIELGGSLGVVAALIRSRLASGVRHLVVEANPALISVCTENAGGAGGESEIIEAAVYYGGPVARFSVGGNVHANALATGDQVTDVVEAKAVTLRTLWEQLGEPEGYTLVCDIEGGELEMVLAEPEVLSKAGLVIMELHPGVYPQGAEDERRVSKGLHAAGLVLCERIGDVGAWRRDRN